MQVLTIFKPQKMKEPTCRSNSKGLLSFLTENEDGTESVEPMLKNLRDNRPNAFGTYT